MKSKGGGFLSCELCLLPFSDHGDKILRHTHSEPVCLETSHRHTGGSSFWVGKYESVSCAQSCPTLCDPMDCSPPGSSVHGGSPGKKTGVGCRSLLQREVPSLIKPVAYQQKCISSVCPCLLEASFSLNLGGSQSFGPTVAQGKRC